MAVNTPATELLGCEFPLFAFSHCRDVVAAVTNAGGVGVLGTTRQTPTELAHELAWIDREVADRPYGVDVLLPAAVEGEDEEEMRRRIPEQHRRFVARLRADYGVPEAQERSGFGHGENLVTTHTRARRQLETILEHSPRLFASALGPPPDDIMRACADRGMVVAGLVGRPKHVDAHRSAGVDLIVAQSYEAGGHTGDIGSMVLIPQIVRRAEGVPVLAAGGIASGSQIVAALALGAAGVWTGSVWLTTAESDLEEEVKAKLLAASSSQTVRTRSFSGKPIRALRTDWTEAWEREEAPAPLPAPVQGLLVKDLIADVFDRRVEPLMGTAVGQLVGQLDQQRSVREVVYSMMEEMVDTLDRLGGL